MFFRYDFDDFRSDLFDLFDRSMFDRCLVTFASSKNIVASQLRSGYALKLLIKVNMVSSI